MKVIRTGEPVAKPGELEFELADSTTYFHAPANGELRNRRSKSWEILGNPGNMKKKLRKSSKILSFKDC